MRFYCWVAWILLTASCTNSERVSKNSQEIKLDKEGAKERVDHWLLLQERFSKDRQDGVDFIAFGKNPDWQLVITKNNELSIATKTDFGSFGAPNLEGMEPQDLNAMVYGAQTQKGTISVMVFSDSCLSHEVGLLPNRVKISAQKADRAVAQFIGCGLYLNDPTLHDIWAVRSWSSLDSTEKIPKGAYLEFNMQTNRIYGNLGCGEITGYFDPMGSRLKIYRMDYADKNCAEESISISLFSALNFSTHELIIKDGLELRLISNGDTITFIKAD